MQELLRYFLHFIPGQNVASCNHTEGFVDPSPWKPRMLMNMSEDLFMPSLPAMAKDFGKTPQLMGLTVPRREAHGSSVEEYPLAELKYQPDPRFFSFGHLWATSGQASARRGGMPYYKCTTRPYLHMYLFFHLGVSVCLLTCLRTYQHLPQQHVNIFTRLHAYMRLDANFIQSLGLLQEGSYQSGAFREASYTSQKTVS